MMISKIWNRLFKSNKIQTSATLYDYLILKAEQESKSNRDKINWEVYNQLKELECDFMWNFAGDTVKPVWLADNPNSDKIRVLANRLQRL